MPNLRINRIIGQLKGIQRMLEEKRECSDILQQISAVKKAIDGLSKDIVVTSISEYMETDDKSKLAQVVERMVNL